MKIKKENIAVKMEAPGTVIRNQEGFGEFTVAYGELPNGTDLTPFLKGLSHDSCHCPHWGYIFDGTLRVIYDDGKEELLEAGDAFYLPPGHTIVVEKDLKIFEFSPTKEYDEVLTHVGKKMAELSQ
jgi:hypothetical protein